MYKEIYFRINTPSYYGGHGTGFQTDEQEHKFYKEVTKLFVTHGWTLIAGTYYGGCPRVAKGKQQLYLHPQIFSGIVDTNNIPVIEQLLKQATLFRHEGTDIYKEIFDITKEEYLSKLELQHTNITNDLLEILKTKKRNLFVTGEITLRVCGKYAIKTIDKSLNNICYDFVNTIFESLIKQNKIVTAKTKNGIGYRTATPKDNTKEVYKYA